MAKLNSAGWFGGLMARFRKQAPTAPVPRPTVEYRHLADLELKHLVDLGPDTPIYIVSLNEYSAAIGFHWLQLKPKVMFLAETILTRMCAQGAIVTPCGDYFVVAFKRPSPVRNKQCVRDASIELGRRLVGASFKLVKAELHPDLAVVEVAAQDVLDADGEVKVDAVDAAVAAAQIGRVNDGPIFQVITLATALETKFVAIENKAPAVNTNWEEMKSDRAGGVTRMVENKPVRPALVFGQAHAKKQVWN